MRALRFQWILPKMNGLNPVELKKNANFNNIFSDCHAKLTVCEMFREMGAKFSKLCVKKSFRVHKNYNFYPLTYNFFPYFAAS